METHADSEVPAALRERDVARIYRLTQSWLRKQRYLRSGPPYVRAGSTVLYLRADVEAYLSAHRVEPAPEVEL